MKNYLCLFCFLIIIFCGYSQDEEQQEEVLTIIKAYNKQNKKAKIDSIELDLENQDGIFNARLAKTQKWGMFQYVYGDFTELIPFEFDEVRFFSWNGRFTTVINDGKIGIYTSFFDQGEMAQLTVECLYEDYQIFNSDGVIKLALKKDGKWGWVDWLTGEEKSMFKYNTPEEVPLN